MGQARQKIRRSGALALLAATMLGACAGDPGPYPELPNLGVYSRFTSRNLCSLGMSPEIRFSPPPASTAIYRVRMTNVSVLSGMRWQGELPATGSVIPEGTFVDMPLPCPAELQTLNFRVEIMALSADRRPLAYGWTFVATQSIQRMLDAERSTAAPASSPIMSRPTFFTH